MRRALYFSTGVQDIKKKRNQKMRQARAHNRPIANKEKGHNLFPTKACESTKAHKGRVQIWDATGQRSGSPIRINETRQATTTKIGITQYACGSEHIDTITGRPIERLVPLIVCQGKKKR